MRTTKRYALADPRPCPTCGTVFTPEKWKLSIGEGRYCSRRCVQRHTKEDHVQWKGGKSVGKHGYVMLSDSLREGLSQREHRAVAERALGKSLPAKHPVHHVDGDRTNNRNDNLVICEDQKYHALLHYRMRVLKAGGDPDKDKFCEGCKALLRREQFARNRTTRDGLNGTCKLCQHLRNKKRSLRAAAERLATRKESDFVNHATNTGMGIEG